jgi:DNA-binding CsgD family transcriptional regulator
MDARLVSRMILLRLAGLAPAAGDLASAIAVLGSRGSLLDAALVARQEPEDARSAADELLQAGLLAPGEALDFEHPVVRTAIYNQTPVMRRGSLHMRAAEALRASGAPAEEVARHLLLATPSDQRWTVEILEAAAQAAFGRGAPEMVAPFLDAALQYPLEDQERAQCLRLLGLAGLAQNQPTAVQHLSAARNLAHESGHRAEISLELAVPLTHAGNLPEALAILKESSSELGDKDRDLGLRLDAAALAAERLDPSRLDEAFGKLRRWNDADLLGETAGERLMLAAIAIDAENLALTAGEGLTVARRALGDGRLLAEVTSDSPTFWYGATALMFAGALDEARTVFQAAADEAAARGSVLGHTLATCFGSTLDYRAGNVALAEAKAREAIDGAATAGWLVGVPWAVAFLVDAILETVEPAAVVEILQPYLVPDPMPPIMPFFYLRYAAARTLIAQGRVAEGLEQLRTVAAEMRNGRVAASQCPWRSEMAIALSSNGEADAGAELAAEQVKLMRAFGAERELGMALRVEGVIQGGRPGMPLLAESVEVLRCSGARLEYARSLISHGGQLRRSGERQACRATLTEGMDVAGRCGASILVARAHRELTAAGARPRRVAVHGRDALTASELQVATLASEGRPNREIAQLLFVSLRTVETHLTRAYQKLDIGGRPELAVAISGAERVTLPPSQ